jgi:NAD+ kinase
LAVNTQGLTDNRVIQCRKAVLCVNLHKENARVLRDEIQRTLQERSISVTAFCFDGRPDNFTLENWDAAFSLGGDGTVLYTARTVSPCNIPIFPLNLGTLGFLTGIQKHNWLSVFDLWQAGAAQVSRRCMLEILVYRQGDQLAKFCCLNDIVVSASGIAKLIRLDVMSRQEGAASVELGPYRCDGLIIATPTGSTAYSMAAGGPIVDPEMEAMILNPICPQSLANRPILLPGQQTLEVTVEIEQRSGVLLTVDGQDTFTLEPEDRVLIKQAPFQAVLISSGRDAYYKALRTKLNWAESHNGDTYA